MHEQPATQGGRPQGQLERSLVSMSVGLLQGVRDRERALASTRSGEYDQQVQITISGQATSIWGYSDIPLTWEHPFVYSPLQRSPQFATPQVSHHIEFTTTLSELIVANVHVIGWKQSDQGWLIGAIARVAVCAPGATTPVSFQGIVHLTFEAYAYPTDEEIVT